MWTHFFWTYVAGPVAALLPERWRKALPMAGRVEWEHAAALSGMLESGTAVVGLGYWYMHAVARMVSGGVESAVNGKLGEGPTVHQIAGAALTVFILLPLTWILTYSGRSPPRAEKLARFTSVR
ncbi:MAG TPA: hypothetical protein VOA64_00455 [Candidatus Dormibacteraeota bacterium]|nr:hypothetical protein [Candidatus Dormibacteraeota bacterium]